MINDYWINESICLQGLIFQIKKEWDSAIYYYKIYYGKPQKKNLINLYLAHCYYNQKNYTESIQYSIRFVNNKGNDKSIPNYIAGCNDYFIKHRRYNDCINYINQVDNPFRDYFIFNKYKGISFFKLNNYDSAKVYLNKAIKKTIYDVDVSSCVAAVQTYEEQYDLAIDLCEKMESFDTILFFNYIHRGVVYNLQKKYELSNAYLTMYLEKCKSINPNAYLYMANNYISLGDSVKGFSFFKKALDAGKDSVSLFDMHKSRLSHLYYKSGYSENNSLIIEDANFLLSMAQSVDDKIELLEILYQAYVNQYRTKKELKTLNGYPLELAKKIQSLKPTYFVGYFFELNYLNVMYGLNGEVTLIPTLDSVIKYYDADNVFNAKLYDLYKLKAQLYKNVKKYNESCLACKESIKLGLEPPFGYEDYYCNNKGDYKPMLEIGKVIEKFILHIRTK